MANNKETDRCIIVFTEGRETIIRALNAISSVDIDIIVLDDSVKSVKSIIENCYGTNVFYHSRNEQSHILDNIKDLDISNFVKPLGTPNWSLGYMRNYAIILSKILGYKRVLFMDDDIIVKNSNTVEIIMDKLNDYDFVGAEISGMPDYSVIDRITKGTHK